MVSCYIMGPVISIQDELGIGKQKTTVLMLRVCGTKLPRKILHPECKGTSFCQLGIKMKIVYSCKTM